ncbi:hypothetical protein [Geodermatophilus sp. SYSU D01119]
MGVVVVCLLLLVTGLLVAGRWGRLPLLTPGPVTSDGRRPSTRAVLRRYLWWLNLWTVTTAVSTVLAAGPGGRLVMRLLALTSPEARGLVTEGGAVVGRVSASGTVGFLVFGALPAGALAALLYLLVHRLLPAGWWRAVSLAGLLLVLFAVRLDPLRPGNVDFTFLGPGWVAVLSLVALTLLHAAVVVGVAGATSRTLPEPDEWSIVRYLPLLSLVLVFPLGAAAAAIGVLVLIASRAVSTCGPDVRVAVRTGRVVLAGAVVVALPGAVTGLAEVLAG